jgi:hypothetical protein
MSEREQRENDEKHHYAFGDFLIHFPMHGGASWFPGVVQEMVTRTYGIEPGPLPEHPDSFSV